MPSIRISLFECWYISSFKRNKFSVVKNNKINRVSEINEAEGGKFLIELAQHMDRYGDAEGGTRLKESCLWDRGGGNIS